MTVRNRSKGIGRATANGALELLPQSLASMLSDAKQMQGKYTAQIAEHARTLDVNDLLAAVRS